MDKKYTVLLVDDEEDVIRVMQKKIDWEALGFSVIGYAHDGMKALEIAEETFPDVVMTDIKMPYMDGMELCRRLKKEFPDQKIILFTGFDEFEYAKEAIHLEIEEYILKPINSIELTDTLKKLKETLDKERLEKQNVEKLQAYYSSSLPLLQQNFYTMLIEDRIPEGELPRYLQEYQIPDLGPLTVCVIFHASKNHVPEGISPAMLTVSVQQYADERLREKYRASFLSYLGDTVMIACLENEEAVSDLTDDCNRISRSAGRLLGAVLTAGIGTAVKSVEDFRQSYNGAREAVSYRVLYGTGRAINIHEVAPTERVYADTTNEGALHPLLKQIRMGTEEDVREEVHSFVLSLKNHSSSLREYKITLMEAVSGIYRFASSNGLSPDEDDESEEFYRMASDWDLQTLETRLTELGLTFQRKISQVRSSSFRSYVENAMEYVKEHFSEPDLSLDTVCTALGVSESYFSSIFKKETSKSFISYLTEYRMEQAARLMLLTDDKNYVIGERVGYSDANYFSYVFKKHFGMSPSGYRKAHGGEA